MKKNKLPLRFDAILMSCIMMFGMPISAFAAEPVENKMYMQIMIELLIATMNFTEFKMVEQINILDR